MKFLGVLYWFIPVLLVVGWTYYEELDAGSSVQSLTTDANGKITANQRDGNSTQILSNGVEGEPAVPTDGDCGSGNICSYSTKDLASFFITGTNVTSFDPNNGVQATRIGQNVIISGYGIVTITGAGRTTFKMDLTTLPASFQPAVNFATGDKEAGGVVSIDQTIGVTQEASCTLVATAGTKQLNIDCSHVVNSGGQQFTWTAQYRLD